MTIGDRIKARRVQIGLTVDQVADRIGKNRATVYRYESNDIEKFPLDILPPLAEVLNTTPAYLMGWSDSTDPEKTKNQAQTEVIPFKPDNRNVLRLAGRDGSYLERTLTDDQLKALTAILDQMPDASDDL